jgi:hypothetical protein
MITSVLIALMGLPEILIGSIVLICNVIVAFLAFLAKNNHSRDIKTLQKDVKSITDSIKSIDTKLTHLSEITYESEVKKTVLKDLSDVLTNALKFVNHSLLSDFIIFKTKEVNRWLEEIYLAGLSNIDKDVFDAKINATYEIILAKGIELLGVEFMRHLETTTKIDLYNAKQDIYKVLDDVVNDKIRRVGNIVKCFIQKNLKHTVNEYHRFITKGNPKEN